MTGGCLCGGVRYEVSGPLRDVLVCHCSRCLHTHGHAAAYSACARDDLMLVEAGTLRWYEADDRGRGFCDRCGASLFWRATGRDTISIAAGTLDQPTGLRIIGHIHTDDHADYYVPSGAPMGVLESFSLDGRVAVVTGGNRGLGRAFAQALGEAGARVAIAARDDERSDAVASELGVLPVRTDVADPDSVRAMLDAVTAELGPIDVLVNNAGVCFHRPALEVPDAEWREVWDVNVDGVWHCSRIVGAQMVERGRGVIVNVGSISGLIVNRPQMQPAYNASKAAVHQLTKSLAAEWAPHGVRVNALAPGYVKTEMTPIDRPEFSRHWVGDAAMQRYALPEELGPSVVYLASDASSFMTGSVLVVDGGYTLW
jgi:NAD(P)-dependent dehydrogenase (short-subunit alcohol dehydrogenase family)